MVYSECSELPLEHLELVVREVYLPLVAVPGSLPHGVAGDKLLDVLHRLINSLQVIMSTEREREFCIIFVFYIMGCFLGDVRVSDRSPGSSSAFTASAG